MKKLLLILFIYIALSQFAYAGENAKGFSVNRSATVGVSREDAGITITPPRQTNSPVRGGAIQRIWIYVDGGDADSSSGANILIYRDDEATASTNVPHNEFFGYIGAATDETRTGVWVTTFEIDNTNFLYSADITVADYFTTTWKIAVKNNSATQSASVKYVIQGYYF